MRINRWICRNAWKSILGGTIGALPPVPPPNYPPSDEPSDGEKSDAESVGQNPSSDSSRLPKNVKDIANKCPNRSYNSIVATTDRMSQNWSVFLTIIFGNSKNAYRCISIYTYASISIYTMRAFTFWLVYVFLMFYMWYGSWEIGPPRSVGSFQGGSSKNTTVEPGGADLSGPLSTLPKNVKANKHECPDHS